MTIKPPARPTNELGFPPHEENQKFLPLIRAAEQRSYPLLLIHLRSSEWRGLSESKLSEEQKKTLQEMPGVTLERQPPVWRILTEKDWWYMAALMEACGAILDHFDPEQKIRTPLAEGATEEPYLTENRHKCQKHIIRLCGWFEQSRYHRVGNEPCTAETMGCLNLFASKIYDVLVAEWHGALPLTLTRENFMQKTRDAFLKTRENLKREMGQPPVAEEEGPKIVYLRRPPNTGAQNCCTISPAITRAAGNAREIGNK